MFDTGRISIDEMGAGKIIHVAVRGIYFRGGNLLHQCYTIRVVNPAVKDPLSPLQTPGSPIERQFPDNMRQHLRHSLERVGQKLLEPRNAYRWSRLEIGLVNGHNDHEI